MKEDKTRLEKLQDQLYSKNSAPGELERSGLRDKQYSLRKDWDKKEIPVVEEKPKKQGSFFNKILIVAFVFFLLSLGYASYVFLGGNSSVSGDDVNINIIGPVSVGGGEKLSLDVVIQNNNSVPLELVELVVDYPNGTKNAYNLTEDLRRDRRTVGDIASGSVVRKTIESVLFGEEGDSKDIEVSLEYHIPGSNALFDVSKEFNIALTAAPVRLVARGNKEISSGQIFELEYIISSNTSKTLDNLMVVIDYPFGFDFESADIEPDIDDNIWIFNSFKPGDEEKIIVKGRLTGQNDEDRVFRLNAGIRDTESSDELGVILTNVVHNVSIEKPFINLALTFDGDDSSEIVVASGKTIQGKVVFNNNTNDVVRDVEVEIRLDGPILDEKTVKVEDGFYRSSDNTILFNKQTNVRLAEIGPRESETFTFNFKLIDLATGSNLYNNPQITVTSSIDAVRVSEEGGETSIKDEEYKLLRVQSDVNVGAYTVYSEGPFTNTGPIPPKAEINTTYTVLWSIYNSSNNLQDVRLVTTLPLYMSWNNLVSPVSENVSYDETTREIIWHIGDIKSGTGYSTSPKLMYFQVTLRPSITQIGTSPNLVKNTKIIGTDSFTGKEFEKALTDVNTILQDYDNTLTGHQFVIE